MVRALLALLAALALAGLARAAVDTAQAERQYVDRVLTMEDTADAHAELAQWCEANGLPDRARTHWQEAIHRDADHKEARAALGYVRRNMTWERAADLPAAPPPSIAAPAPAQDPTFLKRRREFTEQVQSLCVTHLNSSDPETWREGRRHILMMRDPAAAEPIARLLGAGSDETRRLACEALGLIPGDEAARLLARVVLTEESALVYEEAVAALAARTDERGLPMLLNALNGSENALKRSAYALGEMGEIQAVPALIGRLKTQEPRVRTYNAPRGAGGSPGPGAYFFAGRIITYIADIEPVVAEAAVGWDPTVAAVPEGALIDVRNTSVIVHRTIIEIVPQPVVREALKKISGKDFEYSAQDWRNWYERRQSDRVVPVQ